MLKQKSHELLVVFILALQSLCKVIFSVLKVSLYYSPHQVLSKHTLLEMFIFKLTTTAHVGQEIILTSSKNSVGALQTSTSDNTPVLYSARQACLPRFLAWRNVHANLELSSPYLLAQTLSVNCHGNFHLALE